MPAIGIKHKFNMTTRNSITKVDCELTLQMEGRELPNTAVIGDALDKATEIVEQAIQDSYKVVPERDGTTPAPQPLPVKQPEPEPKIVPQPTVPDFS